MTRHFILGLWVAAVTIASSYLAGIWLTDVFAADQNPAPMAGLDYEKTRAISVPIISEGRVAGYVVAQFVFTVDGEELARLAVPPHPFVIDEAFREIYADDSIDFENLDRYDLAGLKTRIKENVNSRMKSELLQDLLVEEFNYFPASVALSE